MALREAIAALLTLRPSHGYELMTLLESELGAMWEVRPSSLYLVLGRMERDGLVERERVEQSRRPDRQLLRLTPKGAEVADRWLDRPDDPSQYLLQIAVARLVCPDRLRAIAAAFTAYQSAVLTQLRALRGDASGGSQQEAINLEIGLTQARLRWLSDIHQSAPEIAKRERASRPRPQRRENPRLA